MMTKYKMTLRYEGTRYKGWQKLKQTNDTIQGKIESVLSKYFGQEINIDGAGRTDAGVHAYAQVASFSAPLQDTESLMKILNGFLPEDIVITNLETMSSDFHARFKAIDKTYSYTIWTAKCPPVFERKYVTLLDQPVNIEKMKKASRLFLGQHDFKAFCTDKTKKSTIRKIIDIQFEVTENSFTIHYRGDGFLYNMVRIMTGTLIEVGQDRRDIQTITTALQSKLRSDAGETAPAQGLALNKITY